MLERITVRVSEDQIDQLDSLVERNQYPNRSEAIRAAIGEFLNNVENRPVVTDGGLPDSIVEFSTEDRDRLACRGCGDLVDRQWLVDRLCPGCRLRDDRDGGSATVATVDRGDGLETDGGLDIDPAELSDEEIRAVLETPAFQKSLKYRRLAQGIEVLEDDDAIYRQLVATITEQHGSVSTKSSVEEVLDLFVEEVKTYTEGMEIEVPDDDQEDLSEVFVDEEDIDRGDGIETDGGEEVELDEAFVSAPSAIHEYAPDPPELDPESMCTECGEAAHNYRCGSCARPLCHKHHELGAGFCSDFTRDDEGRPGCEIAGEFYHAEHLIEEQEIDRGDGIETDGSGRTTGTDSAGEDDPNVLPDGAEIHFTDDRDAHVPDRIEILNGGWVKAIYKQNYQLEVYPPDVIEGVYTHTNHLEDKEWW